jgi:DNA transformation protein and related proteins
MTASDGYIDLIKDLLGALGPISIKRMFGGAGVYRGEMMFALIADDVLYLKSDAETDPAFEGEGAEPFSYTSKNGRKSVMSYRRAPEHLFEDPDEMVEWARRALAAAQRSASRKRPSR